MSKLGGREMSWWGSVTQGIKDDFKLRRLLMPIRNADLSTKVKVEDKLRIKSRIFISSFILFNASLITLYVSLKSK